MRNYDLIILVDAGIGNAIQALPAVEYLHSMEKEVGIFLAGINQSFQDYLKECYGNSIIQDLSAVECNYLLHTFTYQKDILPKYQHYLYLNPDFHSSKWASESDLILNTVQSIFPGGITKNYLKSLKEAQPSKKLEELNLQDKYILYPGGSASNSARRWPHYQKLIDILGIENIIVVGGKDDLNFDQSYVYPLWVSKLLPQALLNRRQFWQFLNRLNLLSAHAHWNGLEKFESAYIEKFSWPELVYIFKRAKVFIGNDGGLMHLASACGLSGIALFGPTSEKKNLPFFPGIKVLKREMSCRPCQFGVGGIQMTTGHINCPYQVNCLKKIEAKKVIDQLKVDFKDLIDKPNARSNSETWR